MRYVLARSTPLLSEHIDRHLVSVSPWCPAVCTHLRQHARMFTVVELDTHVQGQLTLQVDAGETPEGALVRELKEELALTVSRVTSNPLLIRADCARLTHGCIMGHHVQHPLLQNFWIGIKCIYIPDSRYKREFFFSVAVTLAVYILMIHFIVMSYVILRLFCRSQLTTSSPSALCPGPIPLSTSSCLCTVSGQLYVQQRSDILLMFSSTAIMIIRKTTTQECLF